ncbi:MAG: TonB-dependent receptor [Bacteroidales bacterium]|nr:TonB-dependent receptor [Bacteroidales bacterium]
MKEVLLGAALSLLPVCALSAQEIQDRLDSVVVSSTRAGERTPLTYSSLNKQALQESAPSWSLPMTLSLQPSVVTYNEGGTGLGNSAMTIRGSKGSQINVTLNGITLNDAESQEVFWVNIPALTGMLTSVQVQRGLGTSAGGAGAFGASINMNTAFVGNAPSARIEVGGGSFKTLLTSVAASTGRLPSGLYFNLAWSQGLTAGFIRNADVYANSLFAVLGWLHGRHSLRLTYLMGDQTSGITWDGIAPEVYKTNPTYNPAGEYYDDNGNVRYYPNQTDNYRQHHLQLNYTVQLARPWTWSNTVNYTRGDGYDEYYKTGRKFADFGFPFAAVDGVKKSDMIYRKKMGNDLYVLQSDLRYRQGPIKADAGVNLGWYDGLHWGEMLWAKLLGEGYDYAALNRDYAWYYNEGKKLDMSVFARAEYSPLAWLAAYVDLQYRHIGYSLVGRDDKVSSVEMDYHQQWNFFNPRAGVSALFGGHKAYASVALGHREPGRSDIKENIKGEMIPIKPESMVDVEVGYQYSGTHFTGAANLYLMEYNDMLLETGKLSSSGYAIKENVGRGWRRGIELSAAWTPWTWLRADGNLTLSTNKLRSFTAYIEDWVNGGYRRETYENVDMLLSPSLTGMARLSLCPFRGAWKPLTLAVDGKYVGKRYWDNTACEERSIPAAWVMNLQLSHRFKLPFGELGLAFYVDNLLNLKYYGSAWVYRAWDGADYLEAGVYPQAPRNYMLKASLSF